MGDVSRILNLRSRFISPDQLRQASLHRLTFVSVIRSLLNRLFCKHYSHFYFNGAIDCLMSLCLFWCKSLSCLILISRIKTVVTHIRQRFGDKTINSVLHHLKLCIVSLYLRFVSLLKSEMLTELDVEQSKTS